MQYLVSLTVIGIDAATFLQGYVTCDLDDIQPNQGLPMALTEIKGRVIANGWCYGTPTQVTLLLHHTLVDTVKNHLGRYMAFAKSEFSSETDALGLTATACLGDVELAPFGWGLVPAEHADNQLSFLTVDREFPIIQESTSGSFLPQMLNLTQHGAVSFTKGCYLGQEIVARTEHLGQVKRQLFRSRLANRDVSIGSTIKLADRGTCTVVGVGQDQMLLVGRTSTTDK
ncbi:MAG: hypothetical protein F4Z01_02590 [Gammaproteobacteria bacterium]|nr:hypothetical protein [Gammaproteobacteria bacterium]MYF38853.1 hypothetical protein [Gammaproteobacteria bacterium]